MAAWPEQGRRADNHRVIECLLAIVECVPADPSPAAWHCAGGSLRACWGHSRNLHPTPPGARRGTIALGFLSTWRPLASPGSWGCSTVNSGSSSIRGRWLIPLQLTNVELRLREGRSFAQGHTAESQLRLEPKSVCLEASSLFFSNSVFFFF